LSGTGLGLGDVTFQNFLETHKLIPALPSSVDVFVSLPRAQDRAVAEKVSGSLRAQGFRIVTPLAAEGFGAQLKLATKLGARFAVLFGEAELAQGQLIVKDLLKGEQKTFPLSGEYAELVSFLRAK
jgi:histidyl-tRNA synthetase